jgi:DnaJ-class molecular chaperone
MLKRHNCPYCDGTGVRMIQTSSMFGLMKKETPQTCENCNGRGFVVAFDTCRFCEGQGLVGNERDICRACNGTGRADVFAFIPRARLKPGVFFERRCDQCGQSQFEVISTIEEYKLTKSWEKEEELRLVEVMERVKVRCIGCGQTYNIPLDPQWNGELDADQVGALEDMGINVSFLYGKGGPQQQKQRQL